MAGEGHASFGADVMQSFDIGSEQAMLTLGRRWAVPLGGGAVVFLSGDLGSGKTTLVRGILSGLGHEGAVPSPTYTLVESYTLAGGEAHHFDLYRLRRPQELEMIGLRDMLAGDALLMVEWPERGAGHLPSPHYQIELCHHGRGRRLRLHCAPGLGLPC